MNGMAGQYNTIRAAKPGETCCCKRKANRVLVSPSGEELPSCSTSSTSRRLIAHTVRCIAGGGDEIGDSGSR